MKIFDSAFKTGVCREINLRNSNTLKIGWKKLICKT